MQHIVVCLLPYILCRHSSLHSTLEKSSEHLRKSPSLPNSYTKLTIISKHHDKLALNGQDSRHPHVTTEVQRELGELATGTRDKLATIVQCDSPPVQG